jgi:hypothetical protein
MQHHSKVGESMRLTRELTKEREAAVRQRIEDVGGKVGTARLAEVGNHVRGLQQLKKDTKFTQSQINVQALKKVPELNLAIVSSKYGISMETLMLVRQKQAQ